MDRRGIRLVFAGLLALSRIATAPQASAACREQMLQVAIQGQRPLLSVQLDGKAASMVLDTGASGVTLLGDAPQRLGLPWTRREPERRMSYGRPFEVRFAQVSRIAFAGAAAMVSDIPVATKGWRENGVDGFFNDGRLQQADFDLNKGEVTLLCTGSPAPIWAREAAVSELPLADRGRLFVTVFVGGIPLSAMLDSGSPGSSMTLAAARRVGIQVEGPPDAGAAGIGMATPLAAWTKRLPSLRLGQETVSNPQLLVVDKPNASADLLLGFDFFRTHRIWVDRAGGRVRFFRPEGVRWLAP